MPMPTLFEKGCAYYLDALTTLTQQPLNVSSRYWDRIFYDVGSLSRGDENTLFADKRGGYCPRSPTEKARSSSFPPVGQGARSVITNKPNSFWIRRAKTYAQS